MLKAMWAWLGRLFGFGAPPERPVHRMLHTAPRDAHGRHADVLHEKVAAAPAARPDSEPARRRAQVFDGRLLPKPPRTHHAPLPKMLAPRDAGRLFSPTLRSRRRELRTLDTDPEQLARYGLPCWRDEPELAAALGVSVGQLRHHSMHRARDRVSHYVQFAVPKRSGGERVILAPKREHKRLLRALNQLLVNRLPVSEVAHGFRPRRSVATCAAPHVGKGVVLRLDLRDFFASVTMARVRGLLVALGYGFPVATALAVLMTEAEREPVTLSDGQSFLTPVGARYCVQGAPTSPGLCNAVMHKLDQRLLGLARSKGFAYTRYADDLVFSGDSVEQAHKLRRVAEQIIEAEGFAVRRDKTRVWSRAARQRVTSVTVNEQAGVGRSERRRLRAALHQAERAGEALSPARRAELLGHLAWVQMIHPGQAQSLRALAPRALAQKTPPR